MAKRKKKEHDFAVTAFRVVQEAIGEVEEKPVIDYKALGRKGGLKGGMARANKLSPTQRSEIAKKAAQARWGR
ncbi:histone H1 [Chloroflexota bacterium]